MDINRPLLDQISAALKDRWKAAELAPPRGSWGEGEGEGEPGDAIDEAAEAAEEAEMAELTTLEEMLGDRSRRHPAGVGVGLPCGNSIQPKSLS